MADSAMTPYAQLVGAVKIYIAPYGTAIPDIDTTPGASWTELGATDGDQGTEFSGDLTVFRDNDHTGPVKAARPEEDVMLTFTLVDSRLEKISRIMHNVSRVTTTTSGASAVKEMGFKRGATPTEYAMLWKGQADSPYGLYPGQNYFPRVVSNSSPKPVRGKDQRAEYECEFMALEDDNQGDENKKLGWSVVGI